MIRHEEKVSKYLREINLRYLQEFYSHRKKGVCYYFLTVCKLLKNRQFSTLRMLIRRRLFHTQVPKKSLFLEFGDYSDDMKVAIYTCIVGDYDTIKEPMYINSICCDYFVITDQNVSPDSNWKKINLQDVKGMPSGLDASTANRWIKLHPHELFPEYDYSIYVDGSFQIISDLMPLVGKMNDRQWFAVHNMYEGIDDIYDYAKTVVAAKKAPASIIKKQIDFYKKEGFPRHYGIFQNAILIRKHNDFKCIKVMNEWWGQLQKFSKRDQMSLNYVLWKNSTKNSEILILPGTQYNDPFFYYGGHK